MAWLPALDVLLGRWEGTGEGDFPTIDAFRYREELTLERRAGEDSVHYEQRTWLVSDGADDGDPSHWESGFLLVQEDGALELLNAQASGRVEVLRGALEPRAIGGRVELASCVHAHDPRVLATRRVLEWDAGELRYEVRMSTDRVTAGAVHLSARLLRAR